jgi:LuxR family maltose regulon positive regulatory protein
MAALKSARAGTGEDEALLETRIMMARNHPLSALGLLSRLERDARREGFDGSLIRIRVLQAMCRRRAGDDVGAQQALEEAVSLAATAGYRRVFLEEGPALTDMLERVRPVAADFVHSLIDQGKSEPADARPKGVQFEALTKTELEILGLLNRGLKNGEIARQLHITEGTTKQYVHRLFSKLVVRNRVEAVARGRHLKLLG